MSETINQAKARLDNIRSVEPILGALRTIAMGCWKAALNRRGWMQEYADQLSRITAHVLPLLSQPQVPSMVDNSFSSRMHVIVLVIGSERGLCGAFNRDVAARAHRYLSEATRRAETARVQVAGRRVAALLRRTGILPEHVWSTSATILPSFSLAGELSQRWLAEYEAGKVDRVDLLYNTYLGAGRYETRVEQLIPPGLRSDETSDSLDSWPEPIIETDSAGLFARILAQQVAVRLYASLLESSASENSSRYQLLEDARQNSERLIEELEDETAQAYRQKITLEIQTLAVGAGLLRGE